MMNASVLKGCLSTSGRWVVVLALSGLVAGSLWVTWIGPRRAFITDFRSGMQAYLRGDLPTAQEKLREALKRRPGHDGARQLLVRVLVDQGLRQKNSSPDRAAEALQEALGLISDGDPTRQTLTRLMEQLTAANRTPMRDIPDVLRLMTSRPREAQPDWMKAWALDRQQLLWSISQSQKLWMTTLESETQSWRYGMIGGIALFLFSGLMLLGLWALLLRRYFGQRGIVAQMLQAHIERISLGLPPPTGSAAGTPAKLPTSEFHKIDFIEAELVNTHDGEVARTLLANYLEGDDPWLRARAAKAIYRLDPTTAMDTLTRLIQDPSETGQLSGVWALGGITTPQSIDLLAGMMESPSVDVQQASLRYLIQLSQREELPLDVRDQIHKALAAIRADGRWIV